MSASRARASSARSFARLGAHAGEVRLRRISLPDEIPDAPLERRRGVRLALVGADERVSDGGLVELRRHLHVEELPRPLEPVLLRLFEMPRLEEHEPGVRHEHGLRQGEARRLDRVAERQRVAEQHRLRDEVLVRRRIHVLRVEPGQERREGRPLADVGERCVQARLREVERALPRQPHRLLQRERGRIGGEELRRLPAAPLHDSIPALPAPGDVIRRTPGEDERQQNARASGPHP